MIIVFGNQKGGVGKSTNCAQFAHFLSKKGENVVIVDVDFQKTIADKRSFELTGINALREEENAVFDNVLPFEVVSSELEDLQPILDSAKTQDKDNYVLFDLPGNLKTVNKEEDNNLLDLLVNADAIVIPFSYDDNTLTSTATFMVVLQKLKVRGKLIFLPNRIKQSVKYLTIADTHKAMESFGVIAPPLPDRIAMARYSTIDITDESLEIVNSTYEYIYIHVNKG
jgi:chromosome partitioning protein